MGSLMYRYHPAEEYFEKYGDDYIIMDTDFYYDQMELFTIPTVYDAIGLSDFQNSGTVTANIGQERYVIASMNDDGGSYVVHRVRNSQIFPIEEVPKTLVKIGDRKSLY